MRGLVLLSLISFPSLSMARDYVKLDIKISASYKHLDQGVISPVIEGGKLTVKYTSDGKYCMVETKGEQSLPCVYKPEWLLWSAVLKIPPTAVESLFEVKSVQSDHIDRDIRTLIDTEMAQWRKKGYVALESKGIDSSVEPATLRLSFDYAAYQGMWTTYGSF